MFIELSFVQIWSFCRRKTAIVEVLKGGVKYIHKTKDIFCTLYNAGTMSPGPGQGPAHTGTAGLSQPTGTPTPPQGRGPIPTGAQLKPRITATDNTGTGTLRPHRPSPTNPIRSKGGTPTTHRSAPNQCKYRYHHRTLH